MKYLKRSIKYFFYLAVLLTAVILILIALKLVDGDLSTMFVNGYDSLWQIAALMAVFALIYPRFGYSVRNVHIPGSTQEIRPSVLSVMTAKGYRLQQERGEDLVFVKRSTADRIVRVYEDALTFTRTATGYEIEGRTKDIVRVAGAFEAETD